MVAGLAFIILPSIILPLICPGVLFFQVRQPFVVIFLFPSAIALLTQCRMQETILV